MPVEVYNASLPKHSSLQLTSTDSIPTDGEVCLSAQSNLLQEQETTSKTMNELATKEKKTATFKETNCVGLVNDSSYVLTW